LSACSTHATSSEWESVREQFEQAMKECDYPHAESLARKLVVVAKSDSAAILNIPFARSMLVRALYNQEKNDEALKESLVGIQESVKAEEDASLKKYARTLNRSFLMQRGIIFARQDKLLDSEKEFQTGMALGAENSTAFASFLEYYSGVERLKGNLEEGARLWKQAEALRAQDPDSSPEIQSVVFELSSPARKAAQLKRIESIMNNQMSSDPKRISEVAATIAKLDGSKLSDWTAYKCNTMDFVDGTDTNQVMFKNTAVKQDVSIMSMVPKLALGRKLGAETIVEISQKTGAMPIFTTVDRTGELAIGDKQPLYYYTGKVTMPDGIVSGFVGCSETSNKTFFIFGFDLSDNSEYQLEPTQKFLSAIKAL